MRRTSRLLTGVAALLAATVAFTACSTPAPAESPTTAPEDAAWPRTITHELGTTEIDAKPERVVTTSITLAGTLLAIDAPLVASAATTPGDLTDENGFFSQWADVAADRGVEVLYPDLELDLEAVIAADPDLIVISTTGADQTADAYDQLSDIAPTIAVNYSDKSWQDVAEILGEATGLEDEATATVEGYDAHVAEVASKITVPEGDVNAIVFNGTENDSAFAKPGGPHATILDALGFSVVGAPDDVDTSQAPRQDFAFVSTENTVANLTAPTVFLIYGDDATKEQLLAEPLFASAPAVVSGDVYPLGLTSFRIDYFSALGIVDAIAGFFGG
ncbi:Fe2+-enterobactin ABC transporter substrate-binding protein [Microbacterium ulmi]|uniref:Fe2+-enterobactin ABC transporter substrate-binding protein n=1 Tax=Microbacterium ulmi TaxID=179095 RepID=A0A7Y2LY37_9MICO|nr:Fe2+-enterobactin ABC transporter substrate-binding protein [Microbacterium ulmi]NII71234.1 iron complex transport system substrate-binding protein [Microbacterium ulmi]NNH02539.1 Fe2+-enterobactin ABC transporter substrate-binding protein [Microbacterium ulmi]